MARNQCPEGGRPARTVREACGLSRRLAQRPLQSTAPVTNWRGVPVVSINKVLGYTTMPQAFAITPLGSGRMGSVSPVDRA